MIFKTEIKMSEKLYCELYTLIAKKRNRIFFRIILFIIALASLLWSYTFALGILIFILLSISLFAPAMIKGGTKSNYRMKPHLHQVFECGFDDNELWIKGERFKYSSSWENLKIWNEVKGWLILTPSGMESVFMPVEQLKKAQLYEKVIEKAKWNAPKFNTKRAVRRMNKELSGQK